MKLEKAHQCLFACRFWRLFVGAVLLVDLVVDRVDFSGDIQFPTVDERRFRNPNPKLVVKVHLAVDLFGGCDFSEVDIDAIKAILGQSTHNVHLGSSGLTRPESLIPRTASVFHTDAGWRCPVEPSVDVTENW